VFISIFFILLLVSL